MTTMVAASPSSNIDKDETAFANVVFYRFNPLLRRLCDTVQSYSQKQEGGRREEQLQDKLAILALLSDLLDVLQIQLES
jgi:hypothetical protein